MMKQTSLFFLLLGVSILSIAQKISYTVSFPNILHHEAQISVIAENIPQQNLEFRMSRSSPGRYATHEFGKNVYDVKAFNKKGESVKINRTDGDVYILPKYTGYAKLVYTLYANYADGTYAGIDIGGVHLNMPASFMWVKGADKVPIDIQFELPNRNFGIATQLKPGSTPTSFSAPGLQYFMDSPVRIANLISKKWQLANPDGKQYEFELALDAKATDSAAQSFANKVKRITQESQAIFGELPSFDYGKYVFLASINPYIKGDGMEHRNSTMISIPTQFVDNNGLLGVFAHEFFHCWNVERIRPKTLEPFNFEKSNMSDGLWCAEGFTQYYGDLIMRRADVEDDASFISTVGSLVNTKTNTAGARRFSPVEASKHAVFVDAGVAVDKTNYPNMYTSYYPYGAAIALALDLELRTKFNNLSVDGYMTALWKRFGKPEIAYTVAGLEEVLISYTGDKTFASNFFTKYINGHAPYDYTTPLKQAGILLKQPQLGKAWWGSVRYADANNLTIQNNAIVGTPIYDAGLDVDDKIVELNGMAVFKSSQVDSIVRSYKPGDKIKMGYLHRGEKQITELTFGESPAYQAVLFEKEGLAVTTEMLAFRKKWMGSKL
jgi:predicted metalloprotease with PDZ domain